MLKIVKEQLHSWWWPVPFKTPVFVIEAECRYQSILPVKENIKCSGCKQYSFHFFCVFKVLQCTVSTKTMFAKFDIVVK